jgi:hypothetical protein
MIRQATSTVPIVFLRVNDPVAQGFVATPTSSRLSRSHPEGCEARRPAGAGADQILWIRVPGESISAGRIPFILKAVSLILPCAGVPRQSARLNSPGSFATLMAMRRASSAVSTLACIASAFALPRVDIDQRLPVGVTDDIAARHLVGTPWRGEAATRHGAYPSATGAKHG